MDISTIVGTKNVTTVVISTFCSSVVNELLLRWNKRHEFPYPTAASDGRIMAHASSSSGGSLDYTAVIFDNLLGSFGYANQTLGVDISDRLQTWIFTITAACLVGLSGVIPLVIIPVEMGLSLQENRENSKTLRLLLGFAVGGLLGDVFLHLLPEAWDHAIKAGPDIRSQRLWLGLWALAGLFLFTICEMIFSASKQEEQKPVEEFVNKSPPSKQSHQRELVYANGTITQLQSNVSEYGDVHRKNGFTSDCYAHLNGIAPLKKPTNNDLYIIPREINGQKPAKVKKRSHLKSKSSTPDSFCNGDLHEKSCYLNGAVANGSSQEASSKPENGGHRSASGTAKQDTSCWKQDCKITGYLNLLANSVDNFTHGLAVAASFLVGTKMGLLTTLAILIHEVPHEVGDYAILLRSGFTRWDAAKAQLSTASIGVIGAIATLLAGSAEEIGESTAWILPFTAGGFLNIALVNLLPDLLKEEDPWESVKQLLCVFTGIGIMLLVNIVTEQ